jgi:histidinol-phosphate aminotransferase
VTGIPSRSRPSVREDLQAMEGYHSPQLDVDVRLNTNEAPWPPPAEFIEEFIAEVSSLDWNRYPDRSVVGLREDIAALHGVNAEQILVANGSNEVLQTICLTFGGAGRTVATFEPTYAMYRQIARTTQCTIVEGERGPDYCLDMGELERMVAQHSPDIVFLCSPNNPTGTPEQLETVERALSIATGVVVVDEAYGQFASFTALDLLRSDPELPLVVTRTFSKTWSMAGARLGYCVAPAWMIAELEKVVLPYHVDAVKQIAGRVALRFHDQMEARVARIVEERDRLESALDSLGLGVWPSQANFILFSTSATGISGDEVWQGLVERSVLVRNCSGWPRLEDCLRLTVGTIEDNDRFLSAIQEVLS